ncbi:hypothetical protein ACLB2K_007677 [Fragaria x ananassa]
MASSKKSTPRKLKKAASNKTVGSASATIPTASKRKKCKNHEEESEKGLKLLKRNCMAMKRISRIRSLKQKRVVQFNRTWTPYGKAVIEMKSYIGVLTHRKIPIVRTTWRTANKKAFVYLFVFLYLNNMFLRTHGAFVIGNERKRVVMQSAATRWREFKFCLTEIYIVPYMDRPEMLKYPPQDYKFINADHWTFVTERTKPAFIEEASTTSSEDELYDRCETWVVVRVTKEGKFTDEETQKKGKEIIELKEKVSTRETSLSGYNDVLEKALGKEHGGRVTCEEVPVMLALGLLDNIVATGTSMKTDDPDQLCHGYPLGDQNVSVLIEIAKQEYARVPFPLGDDIKTVRQAMESWIAWPENLVIYTPVSPSEVHYDVLKNTKMLDMIAFVDPAMVGEGCGPARSKAEHLCARFIISKPGQLFMVSYNSDQHWVFTVVEPEKENVYYMDPLRRRLPIASVEWKSVINSAIAKYNTEKGKPSVNAVAWKNLGWDKRNKFVYTQDDLDVLRNEWAKFIISKYL